MSILGVSIQRPIIRRHPLSGRPELNTRAARERDGWIETANRHCSGELFWRARAAQRCELNGHLWVVTGDGAGNYCTCCGKLESRGGG